MSAAAGANASIDPVGRGRDACASQSTSTVASTGRFLTSGPQWSMVSSGMWIAAIVV